MRLQRKDTGGHDFPSQVVHQVGRTPLFGVLLWALGRR